MNISNLICDNFEEFLKLTKEIKETPGEEFSEEEKKIVAQKCQLGLELSDREKILFIYHGLYKTIDYQVHKTKFTGKRKHLSVPFGPLPRFNEFQTPDRL